MAKETKLSRRAFINFGLTGVASLVTAGARMGLEAADLMPKTVEPSNNQGATWVDHEGVWVSGEDREFGIGNYRYRASVDTGRVLDTLEVLASQVSGGEQMLDVYLGENPFRIALGEQSSNRGMLNYFSPTVTHTPQVQVSQRFLDHYYVGSRTQDEALLREMDTGVAHELWHVVQFATSNLQAISHGMRTGETVAMIGGTLSAANLASEYLNGRDIKMTSKSRFLRTLAPYLVAGAAFALLPFDQWLYQMDLSERDAYGRERALAALPQVAEHRGKYFNFEPVG